MWKAVIIAFSLCRLLRSAALSGNRWYTPIRKFHQQEALSRMPKQHIVSRLQVTADREPAYNILESSPLLDAELHQESVNSASKGDGLLALSLVGAANNSARSGFPVPSIPLASTLRQVVLRFHCGEETLAEGAAGTTVGGGYVDAEEVCDLILESPTFLGTSDGRCACTDGGPSSQVLSASAEVVREKPRMTATSTLSPTPAQMLRWEQVVGTQSWATAKVTMIVSADFSVAALQELLHDQYPDVTFCMAETLLDADQDWVIEVQRGWAPQVIGNLTVYLPWHNRTIDHTLSTPTVEQDPSLHRELLIEGGAAFGTGDHATTQLCGEWLQREVPRAVQMQHSREGARGVAVLDYGCGSAILALCALRYGAKAAAGVDIDLDALSSAHQNCLLNGLEVDLYCAGRDHHHHRHHADISEGSAFRSADSALQGRQFDLVVANILAPILIQLAPQLAIYTAPRGRIALSGVLDFQAEAVMAAYATHFEDVCVAEMRDGWVLITGVRNWLYG